MLSRRIALATDLYELTMAAGYFQNGITGEASFELFTRWMPASRGYLVLAGMAQVVEYLRDLRFEGRDIEFLRRQAAFKHVGDEFFEYLAGLRFTGSVWAMPEGMPFFPNEPVLRITAPIIEAQILETYLLSVINFQTSIATKSSRLVRAAAGRPVIEFGARRAHGMDAALYAARAAYIGGCPGTSNVEAGYHFGIPIYGTAAHSWTMAFESEQQAFRAFLDVFPATATLLIDTYDTLEAARVVTRLGLPVAGVRLDSGDLGDLSKRVRAILDEAGMTSTKIVASSDLDEYRIAALLAEGAPIDIFGVGTQLTTSYDAPTLGGVYKLVEQRTTSGARQVMKLSAAKATYPGSKQVWRTFDPRGRATGDVVALADEEGPPGARALLSQVIADGRVIDPMPTLPEIQSRSRSWVSELPPGPLDLSDPKPYPVTTSGGLERLRQMVESELLAKRTR